MDIWKSADEVEHKTLKDCDECCHLQETLIEFSGFGHNYNICECCLKEALEMLRPGSFIKHITSD